MDLSFPKAVLANVAVIPSPLVDFRAIFLETAYSRSRWDPLEPCEGLEAAFEWKSPSPAKNSAVTKAIHNLRKGSLPTSWTFHIGSKAATRPPADGDCR